MRSLSQQCRSPSRTGAGEQRAEFDQLLLDGIR